MVKNEIAVWSYDNNLLEEIESLDVEGVEYGRVVFDDASSLENITVYISLTASIISFLAAMLPLMVKRKKKSDNNTTVYIRTTETTTDLKNLVTKYKEEVKIEIIQIPDEK